MTIAMGHIGLCFSIAILVLCSLRQTNGFASPSQARNNNNSDVAVTKDEQIILPNGVKARVVSSVPLNYGDSSSSPSPGNPKPPILFLHGSFHGAWCWQEHYLHYFAEKGHPCVAFNWRGTSGNPAGEGVKKVKIVEDHCDDFQALLEVLPSILGYDGQSDDDRRLLPIVVSHSMGGIIVMKYLDINFARDRSNSKATKPNEVFSGIVSMCSVPPSGNSKTTMRYLRRSLRDTYKITVGFVFKKVLTDGAICRDCFFGGEPTTAKDGSTIDDFGVSEADLARYQGYFERDSRAILDVVDLGKVAPSNTASAEGGAPFLADLPPCLVIGATDDFLVDEVANAETAAYYGVETPVYVDSPHDVMVGRNWKNGADALHKWIEATFASGTS